MYLLLIVFDSQRAAAAAEKPTGILVGSYATRELAEARGRVILSAVQFRPGAGLVIVEVDGD